MNNSPKTVINKNTIIHVGNSINKPIAKPIVSNKSRYVNNIKIKKISENKKTGKVFVVIYTYDRYEKICNLLQDINNNIAGIDIVVNIFDDCSPLEQTFHNNKYSFPINYYKFEKNHGKVKWWHMQEYILSVIKPTQFDYYIYTSDDMRLTPNFFVNTLKHYDSITDSRKICMNLQNDNRLKDRNIVYNADIYKTKWVDMCFICKYNFFELLNFQLKDFVEQPKNSDRSGVGQYLTNFFNSKRYHFYMIKKSLCIHDGNDLSKMHPELRKIQPLISI